jgi:pimeloyl-ACP methyl ester carboxylesterase
MATRIATAQLAVIDDCGHMCTMEQPEAVAAAVLAWLRRPGRD